MIRIKKARARCPQQVDDYQFPNPVPVQMRGVVMAELAAVRIKTFVLHVLSKFNEKITPSYTKETIVQLLFN